MKLPGEEESGGMGFSVIYMIIGVSAFVLIILFAVFRDNNHKNSGSEYLQKLQQQQEEESAAAQLEAEQEEEPERKLRAQDLDFWDMYPVEDGETAENMTETGIQSQEDTKEKSNYAEKAEKERQEQKQKEEEEALNDPSTDGKHTLVTNIDGTQEWVLMNPYLTKNTYDFTKMEEKANLKRYMENGKKTSYVGVDVSKHTGKINFTGVKAAGVDYVMIRLGSRGYSTGQISLDENFKENIEGAIAAGLEVGVYFYSQAITQDEAIQEANFVIQNLEPYRTNVKYPVAFDMEFVSNDKSRVEGLSREDKTTVTAAFLEGVKAAGYVPMIYGDKEWLIKEIDMTKLQSYDVWLSQEEDIPDYPYQYTMWQYSTDGVLNGINGSADLNICFVGYSER
ncbi:MAG: glycoside hydrolase family 25 protein [Lachnospiraceae bacterium]|nr:glycoside hydrolase family 25 protein [Lachnospiraceae bacterium]